jgi:hypothetical protein
MRHDARVRSIRYVRRVLRSSAALVAAVAFVLCQAVPASAAATVGLWHMDETSGSTAVDSSGQNNNGSLINVTFVSPGFDGTGGAYSFNGTSSQVSVPSSASLNPGTQAIDVTLHVKFTRLPGSVGDYDLVRKTGSGTFYKVEIGPKGQAVCLFKGTSGKGKVVFGPALNDGNWHTITCTRTGPSGQEVVTAIVDGQSLAKSVIVGSISGKTPLIMSGQKTGTQDLYNGVMDEVSIAIG